MLKTTSPDHIYFNGILLDMNQVRQWRSSKAFPSHNPDYTIQKLEELIGNYTRELN